MSSCVLQAMELLSCVAEQGDDDFVKDEPTQQTTSWKTPNQDPLTWYESKKRPVENVMVLWIFQIEMSGEDMQIALAVQAMNPRAKVNTFW